MHIKPCLARYDGKVADHNFGSLIRTDADGEYSESNTIFGAFRDPVSGPVTEFLGSHASPVFGFRGERGVGDYSRLSGTDMSTRSLATA